MPLLNFGYPGKHIVTANGDIYTDSDGLLRSRRTHETYLRNDRRRETASSIRNGLATEGAEFEGRVMARQAGRPVLAPREDELTELERMWRRRDIVAEEDEAMPAEPGVMYGMPAEREIMFGMREYPEGMHEEFLPFSRPPLGHENMNEQGLFPPLEVPLYGPARPSHAMFDSREPGYLGYGVSRAPAPRRYLVSRAAVPRYYG